MQNTASTVKSGLSWACVMLATSSLLSCASAPKLNSHPNYLAQDLPAARYEALRVQVETVADEKLKTRGEAHLTVITPPEFDLIKDKVSMAEIDEIANRANLAGAKIEEICIGRGDKLQNAKELRAYFVVVRSAVALEVRREIEKLYRARDGRKAFSADRFYPHVTLGFTDRDLHESDGVIKDRRACDKRFKL